MEQGQQLWQKVSNPGRPRKFETSYDLWTAACEYFKWMDENPIIKHDPTVVNKEIIDHPVKLKRPYTWASLCVYLNVGQGFFRQFKTQKELPDENFSAVISKIEEIMFAQKFEGAAVGEFNANIISRELGLADKKEVKAQVNLKDAPIEFE